MIKQKVGKRRIYKKFKMIIGKQIILPSFMIISKTRCVKFFV